ncbi:MAG TPA: DUF268 domain-containing protein [Flavitalea sp.]|nr:DUF268 domain-containing protein [Flavitalea sp.]
MKRIVRIIVAAFKLFGIDFRHFRNTLTGLPFYFKDLSELKKQKGQDASFYFGRKYPILNERFADAGTTSGHYFHQDLYVATLIYKNNPRRHVDIGSRTDGFVAHVAVFREIEVIDIRNLNNVVKNIVFKKADLMKLPADMINYTDSISALHSLEHFGLGRYGDPIDYFGYLKAIENIFQILKAGGIFYFSVPIGSQRIEFNAHRVFSLQYLLDLFRDKFTIRSFSYIDDQGNFFENTELSGPDVQKNFGCSYGCGIFELVKK